MRRPVNPWWYRLRWPLLVAWTAMCSALVVRPGRAGIDWATVDRGARLLSGGHPQGGLQLYADQPSIQIGPLTLGTVRLVELIAGAHAAIAVAMLGTALLFPALAVLERAIHLPNNIERRRVAKLILIGGLFVVPAWLQSTVVYAHPDDVLVALCGAGALAAVARRRPALLGLMLALAIAAKPTALILAPLVLVFTGRARLSAMRVAAVGLLAWLPFVVADPRTLLAAQPQLLVQPGSGLTLLGLAGVPAPTALRLVQFVVALLVGWLAVRRGHWAAVPLIGIGLRVAIDPGDFSYYAVGVVTAALGWQIVRSNRARASQPSIIGSLPWAAMAAWCALSAPSGFGKFFHPGLPWTTQAVLRLTVPLALIVVALRLDSREMSAPDGEPVATGLDSQPPSRGDRRHPVGAAGSG
jgi:hypothetical protein